MHQSEKKQLLDNVGLILIGILHNLSETQLFNYQFL